MKLLMMGLMTLICSAFAKAQSLDDLLKKYNSHSVPYITVQELAKDYDSFIVLDTRKKEEFDVSHLPNAIWVGEKWQPTERFPANAKIVVYCTIGVRSENFGESMLDFGYSDVSNLHGSIFSWKDAGYKVVDSNGISTDKVHTYSKSWAKYLKTGVKIY